MATASPGIAIRSVCECQEGPGLLFTLLQPLADGFEFSCGRSFDRVRLPVLSRFPVSPGNVGASQLVIHTVPAVLAKAVKRPVHPGCFQCAEHILQILLTTGQFTHASELSRDHPVGRYGVLCGPVEGQLKIATNPVRVPLLHARSKWHQARVGIGSGPLQIGGTGCRIGLVHVKAVQHAAVGQRGWPV